MCFGHDIQALRSHHVHFWAGEKQGIHPSTHNFALVLRRFGFENHESSEIISELIFYLMELIFNIIMTS